MKFIDNIKHETNQAHYTIVQNTLFDIHFAFYFCYIIDNKMKQTNHYFLL